MEKNIILYFTGTGNSLKVAREIAKKIGNCEVVPMVKYYTENRNEKFDRVGFVFPCFAGAPPLFVKKFLQHTNFSASKDSYFFSIVTCGNSDGNSPAIVNNFLKRQGIELSASFKVKMVGNYVVLYNMKKNFKDVNQNISVELGKIAALVSKKTFVEFSTSKNHIFSFMASISAKKYNEMDKYYNISEDCNGCATCSKVCPVNNIQMENNRPSFKHKCEQCMACIQVCPKKALNYKNKTQKRRRYLNPDIKITDLILRDVQYDNP